MQFYELLTQRNRPVESIFAATDVAEENRVAESYAATKIQSVARMRRCRRAYVHLRHSLISIQRLYRGYQGRLRYKLQQLERVKQEQQDKLAYFATIVQSRFRGYHCRKWVSDFYAQKKYIIQVAQRSAQVSDDARQHHEAQRDSSERMLLGERRKEYQESLKNMHHLLSTASRGGIFRPAYQGSALQTIFGTDIEEDIREMPIPRKKFQAHLLASQEMGATSPNSDSDYNSNNGNNRAATTGATATTGYQTIGGPSLSSQAPYDAVAEQNKLDQRVSKRLVASLHGDRKFITKKAPQLPPNRSIIADSEYIAPITMRTKRR